MDYDKARFNMVEQQVRPWDVLNPRVLDVISALPREKFVPSEYQSLAYSDTRIPLNDHCNMLNPNIEGRILQHLDIGKDDLALEIGTGSGYLTACLAKLARHVDSVEIDEDLCETAESNLESVGISNFNISEGDACRGWDQKHSYDVIAVNGSVPTIPNGYLKMLRPGGRMFIVVGDAPVMTAQLVTRTGDKKWETEDLFETCIDRISGTEVKPEDTFSF